MNVQIKLLNPFFPWIKVSSERVKCFLKGNVYYNDELLNPVKLLDILLPAIIENEKNVHDLLDILKHLNGNFVFVIESNDKIICAVDRIRSIPIFYSKKDNHFIISDDAYYIKEQIKSEFDEKSAAEFLVTGYVTGQNTLLEDIKQLQAGEILVYNKVKTSLTTTSYFRFLYTDPWDLDEDAMLEKLDDCFVNVFNRLIESTVEQGLQIVVPLSGGLDSRIIVAMLKRLGVEDVICFTYGRKNDREVKISKKVAESLGYKWHFIEYINDAWSECYHSEEMTSYQKYGGNLVSLPHIQDFLATKELQKSGKLSDKSVFVPGHTGDMLTGGHIPKNFSKKKGEYNLECFLYESLKRHYNLWTWKGIDKLDIRFKSNITNSVGLLEIKNNVSCANAVEFFDFKERQAKFIVNSVRVYEYFGYEWKIPLWDTELIDFFLKLPLEYKIGQALYKAYVKKKLFFGDKIDLYKIDCTTKIVNSKISYLLSILRFIHIIYLRKFCHSNNNSLGNIAIDTCISKANIKGYDLLNLILGTTKKCSKSGNGLLSLAYLHQLIDEHN